MGEQVIMPAVQIVPRFSAGEVAARVEELAARLYRDYADSPLAIVCIAEGASRFVEALTAHLRSQSVSPEIYRVRAQRTSGTSLGEVQVEAFDPSVLEDRDVLVVDDVVDAGTTLKAVLELVELAETRSVRTAVLVDKRERRAESIRLDYVAFEVDAGWVVGFGMDVDGEFRELDEIAVVVGDVG
jgi:hypoxanthine phosphoribosyltransferase